MRSSVWQWLKTQGVRFQTSQGRQAFKVDGKYKFWGGLCVEIWGGGPGLVDMEHDIAAKKGIDIRYETAGVSLLTNDDGNVTGVRTRHKGKTRDLTAGAVVLASGGSESNAAPRRWPLAESSSQGGSG